MNISFYWSDALGIDASVRSQNQRNIEQTIKNTELLKNCSDNIHVFYDGTDALCHTLHGRISCGQSEITKFTCSPNGSTFYVS